MKKILVPTDFSSYANNALKMAFSIADKNGAEIALLNVIPPSAYMSLVMGETDHYINHWADMEKSIKEVARKKLEKIISHTNYKNVTMHPIQGTGPISETITDYAKKQKADLIVMGTKGASGLKGVLMGSNAERVVRYAECPVISVSHYEKTYTIKHICVVSDFQESAGKNFQVVKDIAALYDARFTLLRINTPNDFQSTRESTTFLQGFSEKWQLEDAEAVVYNDYYKDEGLKNFLRENKPDLLAMGTHGKSGLKHLLFGSVAEGVVNESEVPVITFKF